MKRSLAVCGVIAAVVGLAAVIDQQWHQWHCVNAIRQEHLVTVGTQQFGLTEYSWRHVIPSASAIPDPRDVRVYLGPAGQFQLSRLLVWCGALCVAAVSVRRNIRRL